MLTPKQVLNDRYQLQEKLGERPNRQTWLAIDLEAAETKKQQVVIKLLAFGGQMQWQDLKLFEREAQILREVKHLYIPKYYNYFSIDEGILWFALVEEYLPGSSLQNLVNQGKRFTQQEVNNIAIELLKIIDFLHRLKPQVLHRDIKPSNIILGEDGHVYLIDFGAVQDKAAVEGASFTVVGTYGYTPMEQFGGKAVPASDLYALGTTLIHLLTGTAPSDLPQKKLRIHFEDAVHLSHDFTDWLTKLTEPAVEERFNSAIDALNQLQRSQLMIKRVNSYPFIKPYDTQIKLLKTDKIFKIIIPAVNILPKISASFWETYTWIVIFLLTIFILMLYEFLRGSLDGELLSSALLYWYTFFTLMILAYPVFTIDYFKKSRYEKEIRFVKSKASILHIEVTNRIVNISFKVCKLNFKNLDNLLIISTTKMKEDFNRKLLLKSPHRKRKVQLAQNLSQAECDWLMNEIKNCL